MDKDILNTIEDCLKKAKHPEKLTFGICLQHDLTDDFMKRYDNNSQFKIKRMDWKNTKGAAYVRSIIYDMFDKQDYFFQIDCHTRFFLDWDIKIINCFKKCKKINDKAVISYYPVNINNMNNKEVLKTIVNISTVRCIDTRYGIKTHGRNISLYQCPKTSWGISAAMLFFDKSTHNDIKFDKEIYFGLQFEEQVVLAARYWTHGYDIFTPDCHIIATEYITNTKRYTERPIINTREKKETLYRLYHIMQLKYDEKFKDKTTNYLGKERSIKDYYIMLEIYDKVKTMFNNNYID
jgi:hypothetical protein